MTSEMQSEIAECREEVPHCGNSVHRSDSWAGRCLVLTSFYQYFEPSAFPIVLGI